MNALLKPMMSYYIKYSALFTMALLIFVGTFYYLTGHDFNETGLAVVGTILGLAYFCQSHRVSSEHLFLTAFAQFNNRYDKLNEHLAKINENDTDTSNCDDKYIIDYFNLCAEEYRLYREGFIPDDVWKSWLKGMECIFEKRYVQLVWVSEKAKCNESYYGFNPESLLKIKFKFSSSREIRNKLSKAS